METWLTWAFLPFDEIGSLAALLLYSGIMLPFVGFNPHGSQKPVQLCVCYIISKQNTSK